MDIVGRDHENGIRASSTMLQAQLKLFKAVQSLFEITPALLTRYGKSKPYATAIK
jgi:hypothetical protein